VQAYWCLSAANETLLGVGLRMWLQAREFKWGFGVHKCSDVKCGDVECGDVECGDVECGDVE